MCQPEKALPTNGRTLPLPTEATKARSRSWQTMNKWLNFLHTERERLRRGGRRRVEVQIEVQPFNRKLESQPEHKIVEDLRMRNFTHFESA